MTSESLPLAPPPPTPAPTTRREDVGVTGTSRSLDARAIWLLGLTCLFVYGWFHQGPGYNQHAHFATVRALVEHGTFEISRYADTTGDVGRVDGSIYSNKAPGLALMSVAPYFVLYHLERALGRDPDRDSLRLFNLYVLTVWASALPAAACAVAIYLHLRGSSVDPRRALLFAGTFAFGTLAFPYSGAMMAHNFVALCLFVAWLMLERATRSSILFAGVLLGLAVLTENLAAPVVGIYFVALLMRRPSWRLVVAFAAGPAVVTAVTLWHNAVNFDKLITTNYAYTDWSYRSPDLLMGVIGWPQPIRLYWLTIHPHRGLFYACPMLLLALLVGWREPRWRTILARHLVPIGVIVYFVLFNMSFYGWSGGWGVGPRYLIPTIPFLFTLAAPVALRYPRLATILMVLSVCNMFTVTAVCLFVPGKDFGPPPPLDPVLECYRRLLSWHEIAMHHGSYNLGQLLGMPGLSSLLPPLVALVGFAWVALRGVPTTKR